MYNSANAQVASRDYFCRPAKLRTPAAQWDGRAVPANAAAFVAGGQKNPRGLRLGGRRRPHFVAIRKRCPLRRRARPIVSSLSLYMAAVSIRLMPSSRAAPNMRREFFGNIGKPDICATKSKCADSQSSPAERPEFHGRQLGLLCGAKRDHEIPSA